MKDLTEYSQNPDFERTALEEKPPIFNICPVCGEPLCPHGVCPKSEPEYACQVCAGPAYEDFFEADFCPVCGGLKCEHGICHDNWCEHDHQCLDCLDQRNLEQDADDNARYYAGGFPE